LLALGIYNTKPTGVAMSALWGTAVKKTGGALVTSDRA
jgi:hypothetical protein